MPIEKLMASGCDETETIYYKPGFILQILGKSDRLFARLQNVLVHT